MRAIAAALPQNTPPSNKYYSLHCNTGMYLRLEPSGLGNSSLFSTVGEEYIRNIYTYGLNIQSMRVLPGGGWSVISLNSFSTLLPSQPSDRQRCREQMSGLPLAGGRNPPEAGDLRGPLDQV